MNNKEFEINDIVEHVASGQIAVVIGATYLLPADEWLYDLSTGFNNEEVTEVSGDVLKLHSKKRVY